MTVIYTAELGCSWPGCDMYLAVSSSTPRGLAEKAKDRAEAMAWSWSQAPQAGKPSTVRCVDHWGQRRGGRAKNDPAPEEPGGPVKPTLCDPSRAIHSTPHTPESGCGVPR